MATAKKTTTVRTVEVREEAIEFMLSVEEAQTLAVILAHVGGSDDSPRKHASSMAHALDDLGYHFPQCPQYEFSIGSVMFEVNKVI
jgi:hypothetical protein